MQASDEQAPLRDADTDACLLRLLSSHAAIVIAVSGGVDSVVLMHLAADVRRRHGLSVDVVIATVDHGLRPESSDEAAFVAACAQALDLDHVVCVWSGPKPATGLQAAARSARYDLLAKAAYDHACQVVVTAHTQDDQAETVLMRLARGSGVDGLSGMSDETTSLTGHGPIRVIRPLLGVAKSRLIATARERGLVWREDPSNSQADFERVRIREALSVLGDVGLSHAAIARSAQRLRSARDALTAETVRWLGDPDHLHLDALGYAKLDRALFFETSDEIRIRILEAVIRHVGGGDGPLSRATLEAIERGFFADRFIKTYARVKIVATKKKLTFHREAGRSPAVAPIEAGETITWDNRFRITRFATGTSADRAPWTVQNLGPDGLKTARERGCVRGDIAADILRAVPAFWSGPTLVSAPPFASLVAGAAPIDDAGSMWFLTRADLMDRVASRHTGRNAGQSWSHRIDK